MRSVLLQLHIGRPERCDAWSGVPTAHGIQLTIYLHAGASAAVQRCARHCFAMLERSLTSIGGVKGLAPCLRDDKRIYAASTCAGAVHGLHKRVLVYIADGSGQIDKDIEEYFSSSESTIIPIVDASLGSQIGTLLPSRFSTQIVERITNFDATSVVPRIINLTGIKSAGFRLFISYRHHDAASVAGQLFHALSARRFDVFLDRFSSRTGDDFVTLIREELFDKACILVLETNSIGSSIYCRQEVATAELNYLGLMAVDLPGSVKTFPSIYRRFNLSGTSLNTDGTIPQPELDRLINFIEQNYNHEVARRSRAQDQGLLDSILAAHLRPQPKGIGQYCVNNGSRDYIVSMCRCPPTIDDFVQNETLMLAQSTPAQGVLFGPISVVQTQRARQIAWLGQKSSIRAIDEGHIQRSMNDIASNSL